jgi:glycosyltransferase involved in cell wall biosynthesis
MKILHCCLAAFYIDNYGYQENILPKMHKMQGHDVYILASTETYIGNSKIGYIQPCSYYTKENIPITRVPYVKWMPSFLVKKLRLYQGVSKILYCFKPDIIFLHDAQFLSIYSIAKYVKKNRCIKIYVDCHTDFINSAKNFISRNILHKIIYRFCYKMIEPHTVKFYGTLPIRNNFLMEVYKIPSYKVELLPLGIDLTSIDMKKTKGDRIKIRKELNIENNDFVIITGGKIDKRKNIHLLIEAIYQLDQEDIILIVLGKPNDDMKPIIEKFMDTQRIKYVGWIEPSIIPHYIFAADIAFYPGTHSVLWEQSVGLGIPCVFKKWEGIQHIDLGGNCLFLEDVTIDSIIEKILYLYNNRTFVNDMHNTAIIKGPQYFSYYEIAKKAII